LFTHARFLIRRSRKQGDYTNRLAPYTHLLADLFCMLIGEINHLPDVVLKMGRAP